MTTVLFVLLNSGITCMRWRWCSTQPFDWGFTQSIVLAGVIVLVHTALGGLSSSIYNEALQFFLMTLGLVPLLPIFVDARRRRQGPRRSWTGRTASSTSGPTPGPPDNPYGCSGSSSGSGSVRGSVSATHCTDFSGGAARTGRRERGCLPSGPRSSVPTRRS
ncbi:hypothetical protein HBB16_18115 [Pseudonocardia sp. MCCB 268]|nr:hypothetical protein [Pseudonocardia cytotoxica]